MTPEKKHIGFYIFLGIAGYLLIMLVLIHYQHATIVNPGSNKLFNHIGQGIETVTTDPFSKEILKAGLTESSHLVKNFFIVTVCYAFGMFAAYVHGQVVHRDAAGREDGSAKWLTDIKAFNKSNNYPVGKSGTKDYNFATKQDRNIIVSQDVRLGLDDRTFRKNANMLVIGGPGTGKSRFIIKPNLLQLHSSFAVTDPSGEMLRSTGTLLRNSGYKIRVLNLVDFSKSSCYNPFNYARDDIGVQTLVNCLMQNTSDPNKKGGDSFWDDSTKALLRALIYYLRDYCPKSMQNFATVMELLREAEIDENGKQTESQLDKRFNAIEEVDPFSMAVKEYKTFKMGAGKTLKSILISTAVRLDFFNLPEFAALTSSVKINPDLPDDDNDNWVDGLDLGSIGDEKTALFLIIPQADTTYMFLANIMYCQLFETLYYNAMYKHGGRLPVPVRFMLDEFANVGMLPDFEKRLTTMRKYGISCTIVFQALSQIKTCYEKEWETIIAGCDTLVFLGSQEQATLEYISKLIGDATIKARTRGTSAGGKSGSSENYSHHKRNLMTPAEIRTKVNSKWEIAVMTGELPFFTPKFKYEKHPNYKYTGDADKKLMFDENELFNEAVVTAAEKSKSKLRTEAEAMDAACEIFENAKMSTEIVTNSLISKRFYAHQFSSGEGPVVSLGELVDIDGTSGVA